MPPPSHYCQGCEHLKVLLRRRARVAGYITLVAWFMVTYSSRRLVFDEHLDFFMNGYDKLCTKCCVSWKVLLKSKAYWSRWTNWNYVKPLTQTTCAKCKHTLKINWFCRRRKSILVTWNCFENCGKHCHQTKGGMPESWSNLKTALLLRAVVAPKKKKEVVLDLKKKHQKSPVACIEKYLGGLPSLYCLAVQSGLLHFMLFGIASC